MDYGSGIYGAPRGTYGNLAFALPTITTQELTRVGVAPTYARATSDGERLAPSSNTFLHVKNGSGGSATIVVTAPRTDPIGNQIVDNTRTIAAGAEVMIGPFPAVHYGSDDDGLMDVAYSDATSVTVAALRLVPQS